MSSAGPWTPMLDALAPLRTAWPAPEWTWDGRFECVTSAFPTALAPAVLAALAGVLPGEWTADTIASAPPEIEALARRCGGLRAGQLLRSGPGGAGLRPFALWWPWGDGARVSVRLGVAAAARPPELSRQLRSLFGLS